MLHNGIASQRQRCDEPLIMQDILVVFVIIVEENQKASFMGRRVKFALIQRPCAL